MNPQKTFSFSKVFPIALCLIAMAGCGDRKMERKGTAPVSNLEEQAMLTPNSKEAVKKPAPVKEMGEPEEGILHVVEKKNRVIVSGSIKGRYDKKDLFQQLEEGLPDLEIVDELEAGGNRIAMGWESRVGSALLVQLINSVEKAELHYEKGIVRLEGTVSDESAIQTAQMSVINTIYGPYSRDIKNNLKVK